MKNFAIIGLGKFASRLVDTLSEIETAQLVIVDMNKELVQEYETRAVEAYILDKMTKDNLKRVLPAELDAVIIDFEDNLDLASLVTHYIYQLGATKNIYVRTESDDHSEILETLGATRVISPSRDAAVNLTPILISPLLSTYNVMGHGMVTAEMRVPHNFLGKTLVELDLRRQKGINVIAIRHVGSIGYDFIGGNYRLEEGDEMMITGKMEDVERFSNSYSDVGSFSYSASKIRDSHGILEVFSNLFQKKK
jgi:trk system potassium uptake protein TrkA